MKSVGTIEIIVRRCQMSQRDAAFHQGDLEEVPSSGSRSKPPHDPKSNPNKGNENLKISLLSPFGTKGGMFDGVYEEENDHENDSAEIMGTLPQQDGGWDEEEKHSSPRESAKLAPHLRS